ncbi:hypothetical protein QTG54_004459 [Skeletonema marinoi]|uniref:Uncharacterized protein n=1 Tax=Skeletonema marinoi TaxID=267567 RepID=A0AAD9DGW1_9STRA|nr:hypothetical protein QTG54_004459 [Skeletonema marinoi]
MMSRFLLQTFILAVLVSVASAFVAPSSQGNKSTQLMEKKWDADEERTQQQQFSFPNPLTEFADMWQNFDDIIDDFFNKRMGNGEVFYGQRKYKPSGKVTTEYNGYGFIDFKKIEAAREFREERARMKEEKLAAAQKEKNLR